MDKRDNLFYAITCIVAGAVAIAVSASLLIYTALIVNDEPQRASKDDSVYNIPTTPRHMDDITTLSINDSKMKDRGENI